MKEKTRHIAAWCCALLMISLTLRAQPKEKTVPFTIEGTVSNSTTTEKLVGVNIYLKRKPQEGTVSNAQGLYTLTVPAGNHILVFRYLGYEQKEVEINARADMTVNVSLVPASTAIQEVRITSQRKFFGNMDYGRDIPSIDASVIEHQSINNASDILHARIAGVWATKTSGAPGDHQKIRVRGQNSFFSSAEPLYVVDGVPVPIVNLSSLGIADLNIHDIENVTILKDASSTALYGFQGGNGVVLIDTKKGSENEIRFSAKMGYQWFDNPYDLMSSEEQLVSLDSAQSKLRAPMINFYPRLTDSLCNRDWQQEIFSPGNMQGYQLSASGTKGSLKYYLSGNYTDHQGILPNSSYNRYTFFTKIGRTFGERLAIDLAYRGSWQENRNNQDEYKGNRIIYEGISKSPSLECTPDSLLRNSMGRPNQRIFYNYPLLNQSDLPTSIIDEHEHELNIGTHALSAFARLRLTDHLNIDIMESFMYRDSYYHAGFTYNNFNQFGYAGNSDVLLESQEDVILFNHQVNLSYYNTFQKHDVGVVLAHRYYKDNLWWQADSLQGTFPEHYSLKNSMAAYGPKGSVVRDMSSYIGHASYNYHKTYFLSAIANVSQVKEGLHIDYYHLFPSLALSVDMARLWPLRHSQWTDHFKVYANWGRSGNYPLNGLGNDLYEDVPFSTGNNTSYRPSVLQLANHDLRHESTTELDYGIKGTWWNKRLTLGATYYNKDIENLIILRDIPHYYGGGKQYLNIGAIRVTGVDLQAEVIPVSTPDLTWYMKFNIATSRQTVTRLIEGEDLFFNDYDILMPEFTISEGQSLGDIYGYKHFGEWTAADEEAEDNRYVRHGGLKYLNADSTNTRLDRDDKVAIGNSVPDYTWNLHNTLHYKNFTVDFHWYAVWGMDKYNATRAATIMTGVNRDVNTYISDTTEAIQSGHLYQSSEFIEDAGFVRLKTLSFRYEPSKKLMDKVKCTFSLSVENLVTLTRYKGYDPEAAIFTDNNFSDNAIDRGAYPNPNAIYATIDFKL